MFDAVVFDLGGVLIDWDPRYLYRKLLPDEASVEDFLSRVCTREWHVRQDEGRPLAEAVAERCALFPEHEALIQAFYGRWSEMIRAPITGTVRLLEALDAEGVPCYALSNWPAETFDVCRERFDFLSCFRGLVLSGEEGVKKPSPEIYRRLLDRYGLEPARLVFIDDVTENLEPAHELGITTLRFHDPETLNLDLGRLGLL